MRPVKLLPPYQDIRKVFAISHASFALKGAARLSIFFTEKSWRRNPKAVLLQPVIAGIAQLVEHNLAKVGVASSSLVSRSQKSLSVRGLFLFIPSTLSRLPAPIISYQYNFACQSMNETALIHCRDELNSTSFFQLITPSGSQYSCMNCIVNLLILWA